MSQSGMTIERLTKLTKIELFLKKYYDQPEPIQGISNSSYDPILIIRNNLKELDTFSYQYTDQLCLSFIRDSKDEIRGKFIDKLISNLRCFANSNNDERHKLFDIVSNMIL